MIRTIIITVWIIFILFFIQGTLKGWKFYFLLLKKRPSKDPDIKSFLKNLIGLSIAVVPFNIYSLLQYAGFNVGSYAKQGAEILSLLLILLAGWIGGFIIYSKCLIILNCLKKKFFASVKTYYNKYHGFYIDVPDNWLCPPGLLNWFKKDDPTFYCGSNERFNFVIGPLVPEPKLDQTECDFRLYAASYGYTELVFGKIIIKGKEYLWARYHIPPSNWNKKYMIVIRGIEYAITAATNNRKTFKEKEKNWDNIVSTFRLKS